MKKPVFNRLVEDIAEAWHILFCAMAMAGAVASYYGWLTKSFVFALFVVAAPVFVRGLFPSKPNDQK
ncbi:hypothetical protein [Gimibacter soli]|uniref:Uncharacterized protein n=1 Tax=Gimibacter soli TaxID=3024400 RepID=A0AAE9XST4_9PROT|nr:hypothetical protein [Gimibacter soli]WCL54415.1 hypothetical protein PH603_01410 [Gimibacter soli]